MFPARKRIGTVSTTVDAAQYVRLSYTNGSANLTATGTVANFPTLVLQSAATVTSNRLVIPAGAGGNRTTRVYGNSAVDGIMRLDNLTGTYKCKFWACNIIRHVGTTAITAAERFGQYGRQGSDASPNNTGGWVFRINYGTGAFPTGSISFAIHTDYLASPPKSDFGTGQSDPDYPDPIYTTAVIADATWEAGVSILFGVDASVTPFRAIAYINGVLDGSDSQNALALPYYPLPGIDDAGTPANNSIAGGLTLFAQSKNDQSAVLKDAEVSPVVIGQATDTAHLATLAATLHADPFTTSIY